MVYLNINESCEAQVLVLTGFIISIGLIILTIFVNSAILSSIQSSQGETNFPKHEIRDIRIKTYEQVRAAARKASDNTTFVKLISDYSDQLSKLLAQKGVYADIRVIPNCVAGKIRSIEVRIVYNDMNNDYESIETIFIY
jgi:hypothetical protein